MGEAARYVRVPAPTLTSWVFGRPYPTRRGTGHFRPLIRAADPVGRILSFNNLVEGHVLRALRTTHGLDLKTVRSAIDYAEHELGLRRLLLNKQLLSDGKSLLLEKYGDLLNLSASGQIAMRVMLEAHLRRVEWDNELPLRLYPFVRKDVDAGPKSIAIDPAIGFGRPIVQSCGVSTKVIVDRLDAGEPVNDLAADYGVAVGEIEEAAVYERAA